MEGKRTKNKQGGFILKLIIFIIAIILIMSYFHITVADVINWVIGVLQSLARISASR